jgi:hypothetical protein
MDKEEIYWLFGIVQGWFSAKLGLGSKISSDGSQLSAQFPWPPMQPQGHNKQESTTFILPYGSSKQHCMGKEEFHWFFGVMQGWFSAKLGLGSKISSDGSLLSSQLQPIQVGYSIPVFCCISYIVAWYFVPITCIGHSSRTAMQQESHDTSFNVPHKKVGLLLNS